MESLTDRPRSGIPQHDSRLTIKMLDAIRSFFTENMTAPEEPTDEDQGHPSIQVAACALLLELAYADNEFAESERRHLEAAIRRHFDLSPETARELIDFADQERQRAVDLFQFTSLVAQHYTPAQKMVLLETMWGLVYADGDVARHEQYLIKKVSKLLDVQPGFLAEARRKVEDRTKG